MKRLFVFFFIFLFLFSLTSALTTKTFVEDTEKKIELSSPTNYGTVALKDKYWLDIFGWFEKPLQTITLEYHTDQCLVDCESGGSSILYVAGTLFDNKRFLNARGTDVEVSAKYYIKEIEYYDVEVPDTYKEVCEDTKTNLTLKETELTKPICWEEVDTYKTETREREIWTEYNNEVLDAGTYEWKVVANKPVNINVDFIPIAKGVELKEWAWWNDDWDYKREISLVNSSYIGLSNHTVNITVDLSGKVNADCSDLRVLNSTEDGELPIYVVCNSTGNSSILTKLPNGITTDNYTLYIYYGNALAPSTMNIASVYLLYDNFNDATINGSLWRTEGTVDESTGKIDLNSQNAGLFTLQQFRNIRLDYGSYWGGGNGMYDQMFAGTSGTWSPAFSGTYTWATDSGASVRLFNTNVIALSSTLIGTYNISAMGFSVVSGTQNFTMLRDSAPIGSWINSSAIESAHFGTVGFSRYNGVHWIDDVKIYHYPLPSYSVGSEEQLTGTLSVTLNSPADEFKSTDGSILFNATLTPIGVNITNATIYIDDVSSYFEVINSNETTELIWEGSFSDASYEWYVVSYYESGGIINSTTSETRSFIIDSNPPLITWNYPQVLSPDNNIVYGYANKVEYFNFTATDTNLDNCFLNYNNTNISVPCVSGVLNSQNVTLRDDSSAQTITAYANDTFGNSQEQALTYSYLVWENSRTFNSEVSAGDQQTYILNVTASPSSISLVELIIGNTTLYPTTTTIGNDRIITLENYSVPTSSTDYNVTFYYQLTLSDLTKFNTTTSSQLIQAIFIDNCSVYNYTIFNISLFDERTKSQLYGDIEFNYDLLNLPNYDTLNSLSLGFENVTSVGICSSINLSNSNLYQSAEIKYSSEGYEKELYYIQRSRISDLISEINLFDLNSNFSTDFKVTYQDSTFNYVEGAIIQLQRKYISENVFEVVEAPLTSNEGTAVVHIDLDSNVYRATVVKNGEVLDVFENLVFICDSPLVGDCTQKLLGSINPSNNINLDGLLDFIYTDPVINNDTITVSFSIPSGVPSSVRISLVQKDQFGNTTLCNQTIISSAGSLECTIDKTIDDSYVDLIITKDSDLIAQYSYIIPKDNGLDFLGNNFFIVMLLLLSLVGMAFTSPEWIIVNGVVTFVIAGALWLLNGLNFVVGLGSLMWLLIVAGILIFKIAKQEDR